MPKLTVTLDNGESAALAACEWVFCQPCGCPFGVMSPFIVGAPAYDEDGAFLAFYDDGRKRSTAARVKKERERGVTAELMTHKRYSAEIYPRMGKRCEHREQQLVVDDAAGV